MLALVIMLFSAATVLGHPHYRDSFPNGYSVPDPCSTSIWEAVGHFNPLHHTHDKNPFGLAFSAAGHTWTQALCQADSDGDGRTNGEELGDPTCAWSAGATPSGQATGHPGICEPIGSTQCSGQSFTCNCHGHNCIG